MNLEELKILGLSNGEIKVYSAILQISVSSVNEIHEKTGLERRAIYDIINKLLEKGLITYTVENKKRTYQIAPINKLKQEIQKKKQEIISFEKLIPEINEIYNSKKPKIRMEVFRGKEGIKSVFEDTLNYKEVYFIGGKMYVAKQMPIYWEQYNKRRIKKRVKWYNLVLQDFKDKKILKQKLLYYKILPKEFSGSPSIIWIYGNKIINMLWGEEYFAFMIESKEIADNYKKYFWYLWEKVGKK